MCKVDIVYMLDELTAEQRNFESKDTAKSFIRSTYHTEVNTSAYDCGKSFILYDCTYAEIIEEIKDGITHKTIMRIREAV